MAIIKCKMCGGDLNIIEGQSVCECEYCGTRQTVPMLDDEKKMNLFVRANRLRFHSEFDKASGIYESIIADAPEEAEAYWGLVLCKYGIEYVDDPATGKKIPTCHRSSFDSVMQDSDFDLACEYADPIARKVYREEAKQIEEIRKGILEVSSREEPYDIFICYKETDTDGNRTLDSVLAQDLYDALTDKGYQVFFARISLEDKLGQEYEPYIFAALNSAKIMLAVGTDYDYYNAVWVKNEWGRYLKLMEKDKEKHLIPCYKNLDAYDIPKEFSKLQAQDLGKVGAMQDLLRGIQKLLPHEKTEHRETVIVRQTENDHADVLLDRGYMALEDGDWQQADEFFEEVLNQNAKCSSAYLGKVLAAERAANLQKLKSARLKLCLEADARELHLPADMDHIHEMVGKYAVAGFLTEKQIEKTYLPPKIYLSSVSARKQQLADEKDYWNNHRFMTRALQFASAAEKQEIENCLHAIYAHMEGAVEEAAEQESRDMELAQKKYREDLQQTDEKIIQKNQNARQRKKQMTIIVRLTVVVVILAAAFITAKKVVIPACRYASAVRRMESSRYDEAIEIFESLDGYQNSREMVHQAEKRKMEEEREKQYEKAEQLFSAGDYEHAVQIYASLGGFQDSVARSRECAQRQYSEMIKNIKVGDTVRFGKYEQDNDLTNGMEKISWLVLEIRDGKALLLSESALDHRFYHSILAEITWADCDLRKWLNNDFYQEAFSMTEQNLISLTTVPAHKNRLYEKYVRNPGTETKDRIFLLSLPEVEKYFSTDAERACTLTAYAEAKESLRSKRKTGKWWWLRTPGINETGPAVVGYDGIIGARGVYCDHCSGVRPAMWIDLKS